MSCEVAAVTRLCSLASLASHDGAVPIECIESLGALRAVLCDCIDKLPVLMAMCSDASDAAWRACER